MPYKDRDERNAYARSYYALNRDKHKKIVRVYETSKREKFREIILQRKSVPCMDCESTFPPVCMDFDHVRGVKKFNIGDAFRRAKPGLEALLEEIAKCDVVCSNCHRIRTAARRGVEEVGRPRRPHKPEITGSNPVSAT